MSDSAEGGVIRAGKGEGRGIKGRSDGEGGEGEGDGEGGSGDELAARGLGGVSNEPFISSYQKRGAGETTGSHSGAGQTLAEVSNMAAVRLGTKTRNVFISHKKGVDSLNRRQSEESNMASLLTSNGFKVVPRKSVRKLFSRNVLNVQHGANQNMTFTVICNKKRELKNPFASNKIN